jgi:hypothetical protein
MQHKFRVGHRVVLDQGFRSGAAQGDYEVTKLLPSNDIGPQYRLRSLQEAHERAAGESELSLSSKEQAPFDAR